MPLTVIDSNVTKTSISITFSDPVVTDAANPHGGTNPANYTILAENSVDFSEATTIAASGATAPSSLSSSNARVTFTFTPSSGSNEFQAGDSVSIVIRDVESPTAGGLPNGLAVISQVVGPVRRLTRDVEDAISYPILTEEIGYRPSPVGISTGGGGVSSSSGGMNLGQVATKTITDVLGWKANAADPKGFVGALTQAFTLTDVEGHVEAAWTPRTYAVQTDLGGGITGAQASLYSRAKDALDKSLPVLDGLYPLDPEADPEYVKALREMARSQMTEIVKELGVVGLPSILRIDTYFNILLGQSGKPGETIEFEPDRIKGTLGDLRKTYGIFFLNNKLSNSVEDEQDITNFRVVSDYMTSLLQSWISNREFFRLGTSQPAFFGTQLVLISRQFNVITETVNELRFTLDSVFIGPSERQTLLLEFADGSAPMFLEDILDEVESFATDEGPRLLRDGGRISVTNNILPVVQSLQNLVEQSHNPTNLDELPDGFKTARVRNAIDDLEDQLDALIDLIKQVTQVLPAPEDEFTIDNLIANDDGEDGGVLSIIGNAFDPDAVVDIHSAMPIIATPGGIDVHTVFYSPQRLDVVIPAASGLWATLHDGQSHTITVINPDGDSVSVTIPNGLTDGPNGILMSAPRLASAPRGRLGSRPTRPSFGRRRRTGFTIDGKPVGQAPSKKQSGSAPGKSFAAGSGNPPLTPPAGGSSSAAGAGTQSTPAEPVSADSPAQINQQLAALQEKHDALQQGLTSIQVSHNELSQKLDQVQQSSQETINSKFAETQKNHETLMEEVKGLAGKIASFFESKGKKTSRDE